MARTQVAILGGGLAGLNAARRLHRAGVDFQLYEARDRLGGRILTTDAANAPADDGFDLGPSWFWPDMQPAIGRLVAELGLTAFGQHSEGHLVFERMSREAPHRYAPVSQEPRSMRLTGGSAALVRALARDLPSAHVHLGAAVTGLRLRPDGVELQIRHADGGESLAMAGRVIAALPPRILQASVRFQPGLGPETARRWRETATWMAPHAKFFALYDRPFWREAGLSGSAQSMVGPMPEIHDATSSDGKAALFGFVGVDAGQRQRFGEAAIVDACIAQLTRLFGPEAAAPRATLYKDWAADPLTATEADAMAGGHPAPQSSWIDGPWSERLLLAGSEASAVEAGYLSGAVEASYSAADHILREMGASARP